jgi:hypothetical protein
VLIEDYEWLLPAPMFSRSPSSFCHSRKDTGTVCEEARSADVAIFLPESMETGKEDRHVAAEDSRSSR